MSTGSCYRLVQKKSQQQQQQRCSGGLRPLQMLLLSTLLVLPALFLLLQSRSTAAFLCPAFPSASAPDAAAWSGDLRAADFAWNRLGFRGDRPPPRTLKIAVFSRKWPVDASPGGMERHALTLHSALARRGHRVHVFTSAPPAAARPAAAPAGSPVVHFLPSGHWRPDEAWDLFKAEDLREPFDVVHSESVALPFRLARRLSNLAVSWHGIALEGFQSLLYQDLARAADEPPPPGLNRTDLTAKLLAEIRFFHDYAHHIAISDSAGEMLRDAYMIPGRRVHVILNGVDERQFEPDRALGARFLAEIGVAANATLVLGVSGRLVRDKGHALLHAAFPRVAARHPGVWLVVAGKGPWESRYETLGDRAVTLGAIPAARLRAFYNAVDVLVNPTLRPQGLDLTLMEAMQCGRTVAASRFPSIKGSLVVRDELGHMFAPNADALEETLEAMVREGRARLEQRGRACAEYARRMFTATKMTLAHERLFLCVRNETYCAYPFASD